MRTLEASSHRPGAIGSLLGKRVYTHTNNDDTSDDTEDFFYTYDPVGNVVSVMDDSGDEVYLFSQEAFGNELRVNVLGGSNWDDAADDRIVEHQTGKWMDEFTGLYYFWAWWYDGEVVNSALRHAKATVSPWFTRTSTFLSVSMIFSIFVPRFATIPAPFVGNSIPNCTI